MAETRNQLQIKEATLKEVEASIQHRFVDIFCTQSMEDRLTAQFTEQNAKIDTRRCIADMCKAIRWHTKLKALQETNGIESYHDQFELIRTRVTLPEEYLVSAYLAGLCTDTQMNVRMFNPHSIRQCLMIGKLYESVHPCKPKNANEGFLQLPKEEFQVLFFEVKNVEPSTNLDESAIHRTDSINTKDEASIAFHDIPITFEEDAGPAIYTFGTTNYQETWSNKHFAMDFEVSDEATLLSTCLSSVPSELLQPAVEQICVTTLDDHGING